MTPTEQDKELKRAVAKVMTDYGVDFYEGNLMHRTEQRLELIDEFQNEILQLIIADRKRVALEAELQVLTYLLDERTEHMFMQNPNTGEMTGNGWLCNTSLSAVSANRIEAERRKRIAKLKAQQEEV